MGINSPALARKEAKREEASPLMVSAFRSVPCTEEYKDRREGKGRCCYLGDILECRADHLAAWMF